MLDGQLFNPAMQGTALPLIQTFAAFLFCAVFLFLWRRGEVTYFGFWSLAWAIEALASVSALQAYRGGPLVFLWLGSALEFFFAVSLVTAARSAATATARGFRTSLHTMLVFPGFLLVVYVFAWRLSLPQFRMAHAAILAVLYGYCFRKVEDGPGLRAGPGGKLFRFTLACFFLLWIGRAAVFVAGGPEAENWLRWSSSYELILQTLLAFSAMAIWLQAQQDTIRQLKAEVESLEKTAAGSAELDHLTGLQNRMSLDRHIDEHFSGVVAVCDLDYFKDINDRFGHLVGDEVLRSVGHLIRTSIRAEDDAFRWGGDEFVIVFRHQHLDLARGRMAVLEERLQTFRIRGHGLIPLGLSWGAAEGDDTALRPLLEEADKQMYERKRQTHARNV